MCQFRGKKNIYFKGFNKNSEQLKGSASQKFSRESLETDFQLSEEDIKILRVMISPASRRKNIARMYLMEACLKLSQLGPLDIFLAGSAGEGLGKLSFPIQKDSDFDAMLTINDLIVIERGNVEKNQSCQILILENSSLHPGYAYLKTLSNNAVAEYLNANVFKDALQNNLNLTEIMSTSLGCLVDCKSDMHGPAIMMDFNLACSPLVKSYLGKQSIDIVLAVHCNEWPSVADEWIERSRLNWPSREMIAHVVGLGCDLVPAGFPGSSTENVEWRMSFVKAERYLIHALNPVQLRTFVLMKLIFKNKVFGEDFHNKVSSFIAKCSLFWVSEENDGSKWKECHCLKYLWICLQKLKQFVQEGNCPHYFMRKCNVLVGKLNEIEKLQFSNKLDLFTKKGCFKEKIINLPGLRNEIVGNLTMHTIYKEHADFEDFYDMMMDKAVEESFVTNFFLFILPPLTANLIDSLKKLQKLLQDFRNKPLNSKSCGQELFLPDFCLRILTCAQVRLENVAIDRTQLDRNNLLKAIEDKLSKANLKFAINCPSQVAQVAHVFFTNHFHEKVLTIVTPMLLKVKQNIFLGVQGSQFLNIFSSLRHKISELSFTTELKPVCYISFFKAEESLLTSDLRLELFWAELDFAESLASDPASFSVNVHSLVYILYMKYKCCKHLGKIMESFLALAELGEQVFIYTANEYYSLNLLGCCLTESELHKNAIEAFAAAYKRRLNRRSVLFHTALLLQNCFEDIKLIISIYRISANVKPC